MVIVICALCLVGLFLDVLFIRAEGAGQKAKATLLKGLASLFFVGLGAYCLALRPSGFGRLVLIGLVLGLIGDILLNLRHQFEGGTSAKIFAGGILAFLAGHFLYMAALLRRCPSIALPAIILTAALSLLAIPPLIRRITAPSAGLKIFGIVYLVIVTAMFSCAASLLFRTGFSPLGILFTVGGLLFMASDFMLVYYNFGKKLRPLLAIHLLFYYAAQLMIALCILLA